MSPPPAHPRDPIGWCGAIALGFWLLTLLRLTTPSTPYFDEVHYLPAARELLELVYFGNREHPLLGKEIIAASIAIFGDNSFGWRIFPALAGALALFAAMRALWFASQDRFAVLAYGLLLSSGVFLYVQSRIAMLDIFCVAFLAVAYWQLAAAMREPETGRRRLALAGVMLGLAMAAKWSAVPLAMVPGLGFLVLRFLAGRRRLLFSRRGMPVPGITLAEASVWLGLAPLAVYALTFLPGWFFASNPIEGGLIAHHARMIELQANVVAPHPYQSQWWQWAGNIRPIWYLYEPVDGAQRGVLLLGNPLTMLLGLPALAWCAWQGVAKRRAAHGAAALLYALSVGFWIVAAKPVQFYYHYFLPSMFLLAGLALALADLRRAGWSKSAWAVVAASLAVFAWFFPILSAAPLDGTGSFAFWMWLDSWR